jgi:hypothetical protein
MPGETTVMPARWKASRADRGYGHGHQAARARLEPFVLSGRVRCARCREPIIPGEVWHLGHTEDRRGYTGPEHERCNLHAGGVKGAAVRWAPPPVQEAAPEREGVGASDARWRVPWLKGLRRVPSDAVWPRYMTVPHPRARGSIGPAFIAWAEERTGRPLRWWQRLVATRLLEVDGDGRLVWETLILSMARQLGKSWLLRELLLWRMHQGDRFGEAQDVLHTGKDLQVCKEVLRPALFWADDQPGYKVGRAAGEQYIERLADHSRWLLRARGAVYGYSVSVAAVDEAWKVKPEIVDEGLAPTMVERVQPQLWLVSTAHREATALMLTRRQVALGNLEQGDGDLLIEWSAPKTAALDELAAWRAASPHWTPQRQRLVGKQLEAVQAGEAEVSDDEMDPVEAFRAQWLNQWPTRSIPTGVAEYLLPGGLWAHLCEPGLQGEGPLYVAVEDFYGTGAAVAVAAPLEDGRIEVDGWVCPDWDTALLDVQLLGVLRPLREMLVGASVLSRVPPGTVPPPQPAGHAETRVGLPLLRDLAAGGMLAHDEATGETRHGENVSLDEAVTTAQVKELSTGLSLVPAGATHLVKALAWAVNAAHKPAPVPGVR